MPKVGENGKTQICRCAFCGKALDRPGVVPCPCRGRADDGVSPRLLRELLREVRALRREVRELRLPAGNYLAPPNSEIDDTIPF